MATAHRESLAEDLLLLALHDERGTSHLPEKELRRALATATVMDLALGGQIATQGGQVTIVGRTPVDDPVCAHALRCIAQSATGKTVKECHAVVEAGMPDIAARVREGLVARGVLHHAHHRVLRVGPMTEHFPERDGQIEHDLRTRLRDVCLHGRGPDARIAVLAALIVSYRLDGGLFSDDERPVAQARLHDVARGLHKRAQSDAAVLSSGIASASHIAGASNVSGNALVDFAADIGVSIALDLLLDIIPSLLGGLLSALFDN